MFDGDSPGRSSRRGCLSVAQLGQDAQESQTQMVHLPIVLEPTTIVCPSKSIKEDLLH